MLKNFTIIETLIFYDDHLFFVGLTDSQISFAAYFIESKNQVATYLTGKFSSSDLEKVKNGSSDLHSFLLGLQNKELCHIGPTLPAPYSEAISNSQLTNLIPNPGVFL